MLCAERALSGPDRRWTGVGEIYERRGHDEKHITSRDGYHFDELEH